MTLQKPEWFKLDPAKFFSDSVVDSMTTEEVGATLRLLGRQWLDGSLPDDMSLLARLARLDDSAMTKAWPQLSKFFPVVQSGRRANRFMWVEREAVITELERKSDEGTRLARKRWDAARNANGSATSNAVRNATGIPDAMPTGMQDQTRADQRVTDAPRIPDAMRAASEDEAPPGLDAIQYARGLLENLNLCASPAVMTVAAAAIRRLAKRDNIDEAQATDRMLELARAAQERGESVTRFWFEDGKWATSPQQKRQEPTPAVITDTRAFIEQQRRAEEEMRRQRGIE